MIDWIVALFTEHWWHRWTYRNPYDRTCKKCGKHQNMYEYYNNPRCTQWEDMN